MELQECYKFATDNPLCHLATMDGDQPRVRVLLLDAADETGFYFATFSAKDLSKQLHANPKVEICFYNNAADMMDARMMRVRGEVEFIDDPTALERAMGPRKGLEELVGKPLEPITEVFRVSCGDVHFWTMNDILKEKQLEHLNF
jgi:uncharacterized pyridoxamine 5'-phosphate oxidase family protein